jgi:opacity protein-like surface antigen
MKLQPLAPIISILLALAGITVAHASETDVVSPGGFYGGVTMRGTPASGVGINFGPAAQSALNRFTVGAVDDTTTSRLLYGGYRWQNDVAIEAAIGSTDKYALRPLDSGPARRAVGLNFSSSAADVQSRAWNLDVFTSWTVYKALALYGRLGYAQSEAPANPAFSPLSISAARGLRDGMNYGVGVRYDMNSALGLRLEYSRFGHFAGEIGTSLPDSDQVTFGLQLRF